MINTPSDISPVMKKAFDTPGSVIVDVNVGYCDNHALFEMVNDSLLRFDRSSAWAGNT